MARGQIKDLTDKKFGKLTAVSYEVLHYDNYGEKQSRILWDCLCECGGRKKTSRANLENGDVYSCGCYKKKKEPKIKDRFEALTRNIFNKSIIGRRKYQNKNDVSISLQFFQENCQKECFYCGSPPINKAQDKKRGKLISDYVLSYNGLDRIDPSKGYEENNCVTCCWICNQMKLDQSQKDFFSRVRRYNQLPKISERKFFLVEEPLENYSINELKLWNKIFKEKIIYQHKKVDIGLAEFIFLVKSNCFYCGEKPSRIRSHEDCVGSVVCAGIDRLDSSIGYLTGNVVPCCKQCNVGKMDCSLEEICRRYEEIYKRHLM